MVELFTEYVKQNSKAILVLAGIGELEEDIKKMVKEKQIEDKVLFLGLRRDTYRLYQAFDVFIMPSLYEGLPFVMVEAQTAGLPCIISSRISEDAVITSEVTKYELDGNLKPWIESLKSYESGYQRRSNAVIMEESGFDVRRTIEILIKLYC